MILIMANVAGWICRLGTDQLAMDPAVAATHQTGSSVAVLPR